MNYKTSEKAVISLLGKPSTYFKNDDYHILQEISISGEDISIQLQEDGRATYRIRIIRVMVQEFIQQ